MRSERATGLATPAERRRVDLAEFGARVEQLERAVGDAAQFGIGLVQAEPPVCGLEDRAHGAQRLVGAVPFQRHHGAHGLEGRAHDQPVNPA